MSCRLSCVPWGMKDGEAMPKKSSIALAQSFKEQRVREVRVTAAGGLGSLVCSNTSGDWASTSRS